jgi:hypothetical protein
VGGTTCCTSALELEVADSLKMSVIRYQTVRFYNPEAHSLNNTTAAVSAEIKHHATFILALSLTLQYTHTVFAMAIEFLYVPK